MNTELASWKEINAAAKTIKRNGNDIPMKFFFNLFGNTDIVVVESDGGRACKHYIWDVVFEAKPLGAVGAMAIWNAALHAAVKTTPREWELSFKRWIGAFLIQPGTDERYLKVNLAERYLGSLLDVNEKRSPFDTMPLQYPENILQMFEYAVY
jgi:hypothetical protein